MDFQPLYNLDGLVPSNKSFSPPRSMMISLDEQLSAFGNQTFWFSDGMPLSSIGSLLQDTRIQLSEMTDPCNVLPIEPKFHPGPSHPTQDCSYFSQESSNVEIEVTAPNTQPFDLNSLNLSDFYESKNFSTVSMLMKYVNSTTIDDPFQNSMESCSGEEIDNLNPVDVLDMDMDMPISSVSTVASTPEIKNTEMSQVSTSRKLVKQSREPVKESREPELSRETMKKSREPVKHSIESRGKEKVENLNPTGGLKVSTKTAPVPAPTITSALKPKSKKPEKYESSDYSSRRLKSPLVCEICDKMFLNNSSLKQHMSFHRPQRPYQCEYAGCEKSYKTRSELNRHVIVHIGQKNYKCLKCGKTFLRKQYLKTHLIRHNEGLTWQCSLCAKIFVSEDDLDKHKISYHKNGKRSGGGHSSKFVLEYQNENDSLEA